MYKLVILIESREDWQAFDEGWPQFLHHAESMPGLRKEVTCRVDEVLYGAARYAMLHELHFDSPQALQQAMASPAGRQAGQILQQITRGQMALMLCDHKEDDSENLRKYRETREEAESDDAS